MNISVNSINQNWMIKHFLILIIGVIVFFLSPERAPGQLSSRVKKFYSDVGIKVIKRAETLQISGDPSQTFLWIGH